MASAGIYYDSKQGSSCLSHSQLYSAPQFSNLVKNFTADFNRFQNPPLIFTLPYANLAPDQGDINLLQLKSASGQ